MTINNYQAGILPSDGNAPSPHEDWTIGNYTAANPYYSFCGSDDQAADNYVYGVDVCSTILNQTALSEYFSSECLGGNNCTINFQNFTYTEDDWPTTFKEAH